MQNNFKEKNGFISRDRLLTISDRLRVANLHKKELNFKYVVIGDFGVGKTSIIQRYTDGEFSSSYKVTIGADFAVKTLEWDEELRIHLHLWDIAGHERFGTLTGIFYRHSVGAALVFDLTRPETFKSTLKWLTDLRNKVHLPGGQPIPTILLANKGDVTTNTLPNDIDVFCKENQIMAWYITSAKDNVHIDDAMIRLTHAALRNHHSLQFPLITDDVIRLTTEADKSTKENSAEEKERKFLCCSY
ncbi:ras-related protein Rab-32-like [Sitophilus oryzae]|uniref:Ras-related protein Rab-32-like n=1 Tax=Sitophilus oryzae TaxID=7048 RepID=A0A6J2XSP9_SITOR|nr:ras-related protein Rab-32-like [Sitophilus oryzae]